MNIQARIQSLAFRNFILFSVLKSQCLSTHSFKFVLANFHITPALILFVLIDKSLKLKHHNEARRTGIEVKHLKFRPDLQNASTRQC